jgi:hypothetical protein
MAANRVTLRLYQRMSKIAEQETNLDVNDEKFLRETLERMVLEKRGTLKLNLSDFKMIVHRPGGSILRKVQVLPSGATQVKR